MNNALLNAALFFFKYPPIMQQLNIPVLPWLLCVGEVLWKLNISSIN